MAARARGLGFALLTLGAGLVDCAHAVPSPQLQRARDAVGQAAAADAAQLAPSELLAARTTLAAAETASQRQAGSYEERHLAYLAERRAQRAVAAAGAERAQRAESAAHQAFLDEERRQRRVSEERARDLIARNEALQSRLHSATDELEDVRRALQAEAPRADVVPRDELERRAAQLEEEKARLEDQLAVRDRALAAAEHGRAAAEDRAQMALDSLRQVASVQEERRQTTITLSGSVLFASGDTRLLPIAADQLDAVAGALKEQGHGAWILVEGHTDSRGDDRQNEALSESRALAVRTYLVEQGVDPEQIAAVGRGEQRPVASNDTPEGRANNRRVEIIIRQRS